MTRHFSILLLAAAMLLSGCATDELNGTQGNYDPKKPVMFITDSTSVVSRGTPINSDLQLTTMGVFCSYTGASAWNPATSTPNKMFNQKMNSTVGTRAWTYDGSDVYWAAATLADKYTFFAYTPYGTGSGATGNGIVVTSTALTVGVPTLKYTVPTTCENQPDLMVAIPRKDIRPTGSPVSLQMEHALTCVGFKVAGNGEKITGISVEGVSMTGTLTMDGDNIVWTNLDTPPATPTNFPSLLDPTILTSGWYETDATMTDITAANGYLMMIPQELQAGAKVKITFDSGDPVEIALDSQPDWEAGKRVIYSVTIVPGGTITITPDNIALPYIASSSQFTVDCEDPDGNADATMTWTLTSNQIWLTMSLSSDGTGASTTLNGTGSQTVYVFAIQNSATTDRTANITMGSSTQVTVKQFKNPGTISGAGTLLPNTYVGAFWRSTQKGERIIKIPNITSGNAGAWSVSVIYMDNHWGGDKIILAPGYGISEPDLYTATPGDAEDYEVEGTAIGITGTVAIGDSIVFRIGLDLSSGANPNTWDDYDETTMPARYAVVLLSYNNYNKHQKIYLRQGEGPDELITGSGVRWSPYNLREANYAAVPTLLSSSNRPVFTDYPSQGGYYFKWNSLYAIPITYTTADMAWNTITHNNTVTFNTSTDPCTRVASVGFVTAMGSAANSTMESGGLPASSSTTHAGKYSDGWYDRREISPVASASKSVILARGGIQATFTGHILRSGNRTLFFPLAGARTNTGAIYSMNEYSYYQISWRNTTMLMRVILPYVYSVYQIDDTPRTSPATPVRCVRVSP